MKDPSELVSTTVTHEGRQLRIVGYETEPKRTEANRDGQPVFLVIEGERSPPYSNWEQVLVTDILGKRGTV